MGSWTVIRSLISAAMAANILAASGTTDARPPKAMGKVYIWSFSIDPIAGISEREIANVGCQGVIAEADFHHLLRKGSRLGRAYNSGNIRAEVVVNRDEIYFVDVGGVVRSSSGKAYALDTAAFQNMVKFVVPCHKAPQ